MATPRGLLRRVVDRVAAAAGYQPSAGGQRVYAGAAMNRLTADWITAPLSADAAIRGDLRALRDRARQLVRDDAHAKRAVTAASDNIIGPEGIRLQALVALPDGTPDEATNIVLEEGWQDWGLPEHATVDGMLSFTDAMALAVETWKQDGEALIRLWDGYDNAHGFAIQLIDADLLDHTLNQAAAPGQNEIRMGVERDRWGRPVFYHLWRRHPYEGGVGAVTAIDQGRERVPASDIIHLFSVERPGQSRGVTHFACVMGDLNQLAGYQEAELVAARTGAANAVVYEQDPLHSAVPSDTPTSLPLEVEPGTGTLLPVGVKATMLAAEHPTTAFPAFIKTFLRRVAAGIRMSYALLTGDLSDANYSSQREGKLQERDHWRRAQRWIAVLAYRRIYLRWMRMAYLAGRLRLPSAQLARFQAHRWLPRGWPWVDPEKDLKAAALEIALRLNTRENLAAASGRDFREVAEQLQREEALLETLGLTSLGAMPGGAAAPAAAEDETADDAASDEASDDAAAAPRPRRPRARAAGSGTRLDTRHETRHGGRSPATRRLPALVRLALD